MDGLIFSQITLRSLVGWVCWPCWPPLFHM